MSKAETQKEDGKTFLEDIFPRIGEVFVAVFVSAGLGVPAVGASLGKDSDRPKLEHLWFKMRKWLPSQETVVFLIFRWYTSVPWASTKRGTGAVCITACNLIITMNLDTSTWHDSIHPFLGHVGKALCPTLGVPPAPALLGITAGCNVSFSHGHFAGKSPSSLAKDVLFTCRIMTVHII